MRKLTVAGTALASIAGTAGLLFMAPTGVQAQVPGASASTTTAPTATTSPTSDDPAGHPGRDGDRPDGPGHGPFGGLSAAAKALGLTDAQLRQQLDAGKTIADVAKAKGISVDTVVKALVADAKTRLAQAVTAGKLTQARADTISADLTTRITDLVNGKRPAFPGGGPGRGWDHPAGAGAPGTSGN
ncbi:MAG: hypothetical protein HYX34_14620 [Actinobacteria bacterium]|nr:hypothetical protein [Actinomycetota bacterium]